MPVVTIPEESKRLSGFYVPLFEVRISGAGLPRDVLRDVTQLTYRDSIEEIDGFELTVNNWDASTATFKYVGAETQEALEGGGEEAQRFRLFEPCGKDVQVHMGYLGDLRLMLTGTFTTMEPNFPSSGGPTLAVRGLNVLHKLRDRQRTDAWENLRDSEIAQRIGRRFPIPVDIDPKALSQEKPIDFVMQRNQHDIEFLLLRARERGYVVYVKEDDDERRLYFGPSDTRREPVTYALEWGRSLIDFKPTLTTANQVRSVTVNGWNRRTKQPISETVTLDDQRLTRNRDLHERLLESRCEPREDVVVDEPVFTPAEARERALAILNDRQKEMVKASGSTVGLPDLRAGRRVEIVGLGARFSGSYFVTESTHTIDDSGYITRFQARREDEGGGTAA